MAKTAKRETVAASLYYYPRELHGIGSLFGQATGTIANGVVTLTFSDGKTWQGKLIPGKGFASFSVPQSVGSCYSPVHGAPGPIATTRPLVLRLVRATPNPTTTRVQPRPLPPGEIAVLTSLVTVVYLFLWWPLTVLGRRLPWLAAVASIPVLPVICVGLAIFYLIKAAPSVVRAARTSLRHDASFGGPPGKKAGTDFLFWLRANRRDIAFVILVVLAFTLPLGMCGDDALKAFAAWQRYVVIPRLEQFDAMSVVGAIAQGVTNPCYAASPCDPLARHGFLDYALSTVNVLERSGSGMAAWFVFLLVWSYGAVAFALGAAQEKGKGVNFGQFVFAHAFVCIAVSVALVPLRALAIGSVYTTWIITEGFVFVAGIAFLGHAADVALKGDEAFKAGRVVARLWRGLLNLLPLSAKADPGS